MSVYYRKLTCFNRWQLYFSSKFNESLCVNFCPPASFPLIHGSRGLQCCLSPLKDIVCKLRCIGANVLWRNDQTISITKKNRSFITSDRRQSKTFWTIDERGSQIARNSFFDCHLSLIGQQMAIKNYVSYNLRSTFVDRINVFDCHLSEVFIEYRPTEYVANTIRNKGY